MNKKRVKKISDAFKCDPKLNQQDRLLLLDYLDLNDLNFYSMCFQRSRIRFHQVQKVVEQSEDKTNIKLRYG